MIFKILIFFIFYLILNKFLINRNMLLDNIRISEHKSKVVASAKTPLTGGLVLVIFLFFTPILQDKILITSILSIYFLGLLSDLNILSSPLKRIFFQLLIVISFIIVGNLEVKSISIDFFDKMLEFYFFNSLFLLLCLLVLLNGSNFLDGVNTLVVLYFIICLSLIYFSSNYYNLKLDYELVVNILLILIIIFLFNLFGKSFLGDSGSYSLAFIVGAVCIKFIYQNPEVVSPYFIALLLWYPAIENLFTIIRRAMLKKKLSAADNLHLHHLIYMFFLKKNFFENKVFTNSFTGILINIYNLLTISLSLLYINNSKILISLIFFNLSIYLSTYVLLRKLLVTKK